MEEFEPKKKVKIFTKEFMMKYSYVFIIALVLIVGISYSYTFFVQNRKIASGSITTANLTINFTDRSISASNLSVPTNDQEGMGEYSKSVTITNQTAIDGKVTLTLTRTSGLNLNDMRYALIVNGAVQTIGDVPSDGELIETALMGNETVEVEVRLWPKSTYSGSTTTFVGELTPEIKYLGQVASSVSDLTGKYVQFNCNGNTCENWQIVKVENGRVVLTKPADYEGAISRTNSNKFNPDSFNPVITFNDDSLITSLSTDGKNVYLAKTVKITGGSGTSQDPYIFENTIFNEEDRKVVAVITYKDDTTTVGTQNIYYNETNYISRVLNDPAFSGWLDGTTLYKLGDTVTFTTDKNLLASKTVNAENVSFVNTTTGYICTDAQCAIENLAYDAGIEPPTISSCPNCKFMYTTNTYYYGGANNVNATLVSTLSGVTNNYLSLNKNYFLGFTETGDGKVDRAFVCGIKGDAPNQGMAFCIEGTTDGSAHVNNTDIATGIYGINENNSGTGCSLIYNGNIVTCPHNVPYLNFSINGNVEISIDSFHKCMVYNDESFYCVNS